MCRFCCGQQALRKINTLMVEIHKLCLLWVVCGDLAALVIEAAVSVSARGGRPEQTTSACYQQQLPKSLLLSLQISSRKYAQLTV